MTLKTKKSSHFELHLLIYTKQKCVKMSSITITDDNQLLSEKKPTYFK